MNIYESKIKAMTDKKTNSDICCPELNREDWDGKKLFWEDKRFVKGKVRTFFFIPFGFGRTMRKISKAMEVSGAKSGDWMCLADHTSNLNMDIYVDVDKPVEGLSNVLFNGEYYSRVYEGPYRDTKKWTDDFETDAKAKGLDVEKQYVWYNYCPKCAKKYGNNYITILGKLNSLSSIY